VVIESSICVAALQVVHHTSQLKSTKPKIC